MNGFLIGMLFVGELALLGVVGWSVWYQGRRLQDLQRRVDEALDDEDLLDFQTRVQALLTEVRDSSDSMVEAVERRQAALDRSLAKVRDAEKRLAARATALEKAALRAEERLEKAPARPQLEGKKSLRPKVKKASATPPLTLLPLPAAAASTPAPLPSPAPSRYSQVYELADKGVSREQIVRQTGILAGEIDLILNLRPGNGRRSGSPKA